MIGKWYSRRLEAVYDWFCTHYVEGKLREQEQHNQAVQNRLIDEAFTAKKNAYKWRKELEVVQSRHDKLAEYYKPINCVGKKLNYNRTYYVVSQGGIYEITGYKLRTSSREVTKRAWRNGFVVYTRDDALKLQERMRSLTYIGKEPEENKNELS